MDFKELEKKIMDNFEGYKNAYGLYSFRQMVVNKVAKIILEEKACENIEINYRKNKIEIRFYDKDIQLPYQHCIDIKIQTQKTEFDDIEYHRLKSVEVIPNDLFGGLQTFEDCKKKFDDDIKNYKEHMKKKELKFINLLEEKGINIEDYYGLLCAYCEIDYKRRIELKNKYHQENEEFDVCEVIK